MKENRVNKSLRLKPDLIQKIEKKANDENRTFTNVIETILTNHFKKKS